MIISTAMSATRTITIEVPEERYDEIRDLLLRNGIETSEDFVIPLEVQRMVMERAEAYRKDPSRSLSWEEVKEKIRFNR